MYLELRRNVRNARRFPAFQANFLRLRWYSIAECSRFVSNIGEYQVCLSFLAKFW